MLNKKDYYFLDQAREVASFSKEKNQHGAIVVKSGNVVGVGINKFRNSPRGVSPEHIKTHCSYHAEVVAIKDAGPNTIGAVIYIARVNRQGFDRNSKPCNNCSKAIVKAGIKRIVYTITGEYRVVK